MCNRGIIKIVLEQNEHREKKTVLLFINYWVGSVYFFRFFLRPCTFDRWINGFIDLIKTI